MSLVFQKFRGRCLSQAWLILSLANLLFLTGVSAQGPGVAPIQLKAVYLLRFPEFIQWPEESFASPSSPFVVGVIGDDPFGRVLDEVLAGESFGGRKFLVKRFKKNEQDIQCHMLFIPDSEKSRLENYLSRTEGLPILTVSDLAGFAEKGGIIGFVISNEKLQLEINRDTARKNKLNISSHLLRRAKIFPPEK